MLSTDMKRQPKYEYVRTWNIPPAQSSAEATTRNITNPVYTCTITDDPVLLPSSESWIT